MRLPTALVWSESIQAPYCATMGSKSALMPLLATMRKSLKTTIRIERV
jgi:hypothetical protein